MHAWQEELLGVFDGVRDEQELFAKIEAAARSLEFDYVAYGLRLPLPVSAPKTLMLNNYPSAWQAHYARCGYLAIDPSVRHGLRSETPVVWSAELFADAPELWDDAQQAGLRVGWAQSFHSTQGGGGMLSLARSAQPLDAAELAHKQTRLRWLVHVAHTCLSRALVDGQSRTQPTLTPREVEVLKWTADGKSSADISCILNLSVDTVNFHIKNAVAKFQSANKTAAVVRAAMLGMLG